MFVDEIILKVIAGKGGDGCTSFRREKYVPMGGPDGGNGGRGSNIIFQADKNLKTLIDLKSSKTIKGEKGKNGSGSNRFGASADDLIIKVPLGTTITDIDTNIIIDDLIKDDQQAIVAYGGRGGRGNKSFKTRFNNAPRESEFGEPGEERTIKCELKMMADIGLVGLPSVGKSTILSQISSSKPKIAAYHFTTLTPNLGVVKLKNGDLFTIADLPGLIEGASEGIGLGDKFLRHTMRTKIIAHVIDMGAEEGRDPITDYETILNELTKYSDKLATKKSVVIANKMDLPNFENNFQKFKIKYPDLKIISVSALNNTNLDNLIVELNEIVKETLINELYEENELENHLIYTYQEEKPYNISKKDNIWVITGDDLERQVKMIKFNTDESYRRFNLKLRKLGIEDELEHMGAKKGDEIKILDKIFIFKV